MIGRGKTWRVSFRRNVSCDKAVSGTSPGELDCASFALLWSVFRNRTRFRLHADSQGVVRSAYVDESVI